MKWIESLFWDEREDGEGRTVGANRRMTVIIIFGVVVVLVSMILVVRP